VLLFPSAGGALVWLGDATRRLVRREGQRTSGREAAAGVAVAAVVLAVWFGALALGEHLRARHRWAVHVCQVSGTSRFCSWRSVAGGHPVGVWDGAGVPGGGTAETRLELPAGSYRLHATLDLAPGSRVEGRAVVSAGARTAEAVGVSGQPSTLELDVDHPGGPLVVRLAAQGAERVWISALRVEAR
jgi:transcriptional antiterminator Rof (Rho-off)